MYPPTPTPEVIDNGSSSSGCTKPVLLVAGGVVMALVVGGWWLANQLNDEGPGLLVRQDTVLEEATDTPAPDEFSAPPGPCTSGCAGSTEQPSCPQPDGACDSASENRDLCPLDCPCIDDQICAPGETSQCRDCITPPPPAQPPDGGEPPPGGDSGGTACQNSCGNGLCETACGEQFNQPNYCSADCGPG